MDQWSQRMFPRVPSGLPRNANNQQNFNRPTNPQQFHPNPAGPQFHSGFQSRSGFPLGINPLTQNWLSNAVLQSQPTRPMSPAEWENLKKKRNFEEQQKRLMAMKQKSGRHSRSSQAANSLSDLFGSKGSSGDMTSLLGSLGDVTVSKSPTKTFQGGQFSDKLVGQTPITYIGNSAGSISAGTSSNIASSNWSSSGLPPAHEPPQLSGDFQQFQEFTSQTMQDDFGDFQQSLSMQFPAVPNVQHSEVSSSPQSSIFGITPDNQNKHQPTEVVDTPSSSDFGPPPNTGDFHQGLAVQLSVTSRTQSSEDSKNNLSSNVSPVTTEKKPVEKTVNSGRVEKKVPENLMNATASIDDLMKKSLTLGKQSQNPGRRFERPKITKTIKAKPSHFTESAKASKFENLDSLSEMFTIPQYSRVQPGDSSAPLGHVTDNNADDWSDFSSSADAVSQEQHVPSSIYLSTLGQGVNEGVGQGCSIPVIPDATSGHMVPASSTTLCTTEASHFMWESGNEGVGRILQEPRVNVDVLSQSASATPVSSLWNPQVSVGSNGIFVAAHTHMSQGSDGQDLSSGGNFGDFLSEVPIYDSSSESLHQALEQSQETSDPEQAIYGISLPEWCKNTSLLPGVYKDIHKMCSSNDIISTSQLYPILLSSGLPRNKLGHVWSKCNKAVPGELNEKELYLILGMIALAQVGLQVNKLTLEKLKSCITAPIPSFPENIFQTETNDDIPIPSTVLPNHQPEQTNILSAVPDSPVESIFHPGRLVDAVKHPDWSKWKTSKANQVDDQFSDFQILKPNDSTAAPPDLNLSILSSTNYSFSSFKSPTPSVTPKTKEKVSLFQQLESSEGSHALTPASVEKSDVFGEMTGVSDLNQQCGSFESKTASNSTHVISVPLQTSQRYTLTGEDEEVDNHQKAWLKCLTSCFHVIMKSCQTLQNISHTNLMNEIFSSQRGKSHFTAIIEIYCVSQRIKTSVQKSAPNNKKLREILQNIDNIWKTYTGFEHFKNFLPTENFNFSGCHVNDGDDVNLSCGVCLLNVEKSFTNCASQQQGNRCKLSYGKRQYHTTCANFWCNKVDSVLPSLHFSDSLI